MCADVCVHVHMGTCVSTRVYVLVHVHVDDKAQIVEAVVSVCCKRNTNVHMHVPVGHTCQQ